MILWIILFLLVVAIAFVLAAKSMRDYHEIPTQTEEYGLFLVRNKSSLNKNFLDSLHSDLEKKALILSFERLIKGERTALVLFGPKSVTSKYAAELDLLELEDYTGVNLEQLSAWEVGVRKDAQGIFDSLPKLSDTDQFWWQLVLSPSKGGNFSVNIKAILVSPSQDREKFAESLQNLSPQIFVKLPKAFSNEQLLEFYRKRSYSKNSNPSLDFEKVLKLLSI